MRWWRPRAQRWECLYKMANQTQCSSSSAFFAKSSPPFLGKNCVPAYPLSSFENRHQHRPHAKSCAPLEDLLHIADLIEQILGRLAPCFLGFADKKCCNMEHIYSCITSFNWRWYKKKWNYVNVFSVFENSQFPLNIARKRWRVCVTKGLCR